MLWTEAAFSACLVWHLPDHHWHCNWHVAWTSSRMCAGKRQTLQATIVTIFCHMTNDVRFLSNVSQFLDCFVGNYNKFKLLSQGSVEIYQRYGGKYFIGNFLIFPAQWKNFENPLRIDKVIAMSLVYYFFGTPFENDFSSCLNCPRLMSHHQYDGILFHTRGPAASVNVTD